MSKLCRKKECEKKAEIAIPTIDKLDQKKYLIFAKKYLNPSKNQLVFSGGLATIALGFMIFQNGTCDSQNSALAPASSTVTATYPTPMPTLTANVTNSFPALSYTPAAGTGSIPTNVVMGFSAPLGTTAGIATNWTWTCNGGVYSGNTPTAVTVSGAVASVTLPAVTQLTNGNYCTLSSTVLTDISGNTLSAPVNAVYTLGPSSSGAAPVVAFFKQLTPNSVVFKTADLSLTIWPIGGTVAPLVSIKYLLNNIPIGIVPFAGTLSNFTFDTTQFPNGNYTVHVNVLDKNNVEYTDIVTSTTFSIQNMSQNLSTLCSNNNGKPYLVDGATTICVVPSNSYPSGMVPYGDGKWTTTSAVTCDGGFTFGKSFCFLSTSRTGTTGSHSKFEHHTDPESVTVATLAGCGPATDGSVTCNSNITSIGCILD